MKIIAHTHGGVVVELDRVEFLAMTGTASNCQLSQMWQFEEGRQVGVNPLLWRTRDVLDAQDKLAKAAETLRGLAIVISTVDALIPKGKPEAA